MSDEKALIKVHPEGEPETGEIEPPATPLSLDTPVRTVKVGLAQGSAQMRFDLLANLGSEFWPTLKGRYYAVSRNLSRRTDRTWSGDLRSPPGTVWRLAKAGNRLPSTATGVHFPDTSRRSSQQMLWTIAVI